MSKPRILGGRAKGMPLETPTRGTRPSPSRLREALFDMLQFRERGAFLDLYAGSGAIGLEAASRGFPAVCVELDRAAADVLLRNARRLRLDVEVVRDDALRVARERPAAFEVVFAAPPYPLDLIAIFGAVLAGGAARPGGVYLFQHPTNLDVRAALAGAAGARGEEDGGGAGGTPRTAADGAWTATVRRYGSNSVTRIEVPDASSG